MVDHASLLREFYEPSADVSQGLVGREDCGDLSTHPRGTGATAEKYSVRHILDIHKELGSRELEKVHRLPGAGNPADGLRKAKSEMAPLLRAPQSGTVFHGTRRALLGASSREMGRE